MRLLNIIKNNIEWLIILSANSADATGINQLLAIKYNHQNNSLELVEFVVFVQPVKLSKLSVNILLSYRIKN